jgi:hypothetical protein
MGLDHGKSLGYRYWDGYHEKVAVVLGRTALGMSGNLMNQTVAARWYEKNLEGHIRATFLHELGHVLHQCLRLEYYMALARVAELGVGDVITVASRIDAITEQEGVREALVLPLNEEGQPPGTTAAKMLVQFVKNIQALGKGLSFYAHFQGMNEFVAEMFSACSLGQPYDSPLGRLNGPFPNDLQVVKAYNQLGGPPIRVVLPAGAPVDSAGPVSSGPRAWASDSARNSATGASTKAATGTTAADF